MVTQTAQHFQTALHCASVIINYYKINHINLHRLVVGFTNFIESFETLLSLLTTTNSYM